MVVNNLLLVNGNAFKITAQFKKLQRIAYELSKTAGTAAHAIVCHE